MKFALAATIVVPLIWAGAAGAQAAKPAKGGPAGSPLLPGGNSKEPVSIDADKLVYFEKEQKAIYTGNVVVVQGDTKLTCTMMTIFLAKSESAAKPGDPVKPADAGKPAAPAGGQAPGGSSIRHMDCTGPVTVVSKTQVATGDNGSYDKPENKVRLNGHVALSDGGNITKGDRLIYDLTSGQATIETGGGAAGSARVHGLFVPGSAEPAKTGEDKKKPPK